MLLRALQSGKGERVRLPTSEADAQGLGELAERQNRDIVFAAFYRAHRLTTHEWHGDSARGSVTIGNPYMFGMYAAMTLSTAVRGVRRPCCGGI